MLFGIFGCLYGAKTHPQQGQETARGSSTWLQDEEHASDTCFKIPINMP